MRAHAFLHVKFEGLGVIEPWLFEKGYSLTFTRFYEEAVLPHVDEIDFLIIMGGPMSVNDEAIYPWLRAEKAWIRSMIERKKPVLGICLGAQLIANALGSLVYPNKDKEIGWFPIVATSNDVKRDVFSFPPSIEVFHWHGETFDLPKDALSLAKSTACTHQAFQLGNHVIGLQFHLEMTAQAIESIVENCHDELVSDTYVQTEEMILSKSNECLQATQTLMRSLLDFLHVKNQDA